MRTRLSYLPHSLLMASPIFVMSMLVLTYVFKITLIPTIIVSLAEWAFAANSHMDTHYLQNQIDELKKKSK